jgi:23S rRNA (pseudouridine1915-N3)-methyltransferase
VRLRLLQVGRPRDPEAAALHDRYSGRIRRLGVAYESDWVPDVKPGGRFSNEHVREREARLLADKLGRDGTVVVLDRRGQSLSSKALSRRIEGWATPRATFVVGGPLGLPDAFLELADFRWSLSSLTLPHELVRVMLVEQLYRALTILRGLPYHK